MVCLQGSGIVKLSRKSSLITAAASLPKAISDVKEALLVPGYITNVTNDACYVRFLGQLTGRAGLAQLADLFVSDPSRHFHVGQSVRAQVVQVRAYRYHPEADQACAVTICSAAPSAALNAHCSAALTAALTAHCSAALFAHCSAALNAHCSAALTAHRAPALAAHCTAALTAHCSPAPAAHCSAALTAHCSAALSAHCSAALPFAMVATTRRASVCRFKPQQGAATQTDGACVVYAGGQWEGEVHSHPEAESGWSL